MKKHIIYLTKVVVLGAVAFCVWKGFIWFLLETVDQVCNLIY